MYSPNMSREIGKVLAKQFILDGDRKVEWVYGHEELMDYDGLVMDGIKVTIEYTRPKHEYIVTNETEARTLPT